MILFTYIGIVIFIYAVIYGLSAMIGFIFQGSTEQLEMDAFGAGLTLIVCILTLIMVGLGLSFYTAPEDFGYAKIETETVEVHEQVEHPESEVVIDD